MSYEQLVAELPPPTPQVSLFANVLGFGAFGLAARFGQLAILKRSMWSNPAGHALSVGFWGYFGYHAYFWDQRMEEIIYNKRKEIVERRAQRTLRLEELAEETAEKRAALAALAEP